MYATKCRYDKYVYVHMVWIDEILIEILAAYLVLFIIMYHTTFYTM